ncbi:CAP domain-containing protein [Cellulomonas xiejunii]|uniref:CAP domain-containing protein n=1 Tax=Cellulomonas xiejunii TaxID=2968083 RepID=A0ABY5KT19_9CELL|nr:CAP domain-containing protein [Cellulomonas xiejunii]MCC2322578.1 CAP domain-containing protein [Cellulomonas xiejunii]UUI72611.1 CAP domain-containing protein [Cellulomonas xiejunii]
MPVAQRREIRRWRERRDLRRRRVRLVGSAGILVVAVALILLAAPGAHAPTGQVTLALTSGDLVGRLQDPVSRSSERSADPEPTAPLPATSSAVPQTAAPEPPPADEPAAPAVPAPEPRAAARPTAVGSAPDGSGATGVSDQGAAMSAEIVALTNAERAAAGLPALGVSSCATQQAADRSTLLVAEGRFEHDPLGPILEACAAGTVGENLSLGYASAPAAVTGWMKSPGHRENILRSSFTQIGVACAQGARGWLCAQVFLG